MSAGGGPAEARTQRCPGDRRPLLADLLVIARHWDVIGDKFFVIHHCASLYAFFLVLVSAGGGLAAGREGLRGRPGPPPTPRPADQLQPRPGPPCDVPAARGQSHTVTGG